MNDNFNILTCKAKGRAHQLTKLSINWDGMDIEQLKVLARSCIVHALQTTWKKDPFAVIPESCTVNATAFIKGQLHEVLVDRPPVPKRQTWMDALLKGMSEEDKARLVKEMDEHL
jgi:hypothetical protein